MRHAPELRKQHLQVLPELRQAHVRVSFPPRGHLIDEHQDPRQQQDRQLVTDQQRIPRVRDLPQSLQQPGQHGAINAQLFFCCFLSRLLFFLDRLPFAFPVPDRSLPQRLETLRRLTFAQGARGLSAGPPLNPQPFSPPRPASRPIPRLSPHLGRPIKSSNPAPPAPKRPPQTANSPDDAPLCPARSSAGALQTAADTPADGSAPHTRSIVEWPASPILVPTVAVPHHPPSPRFLPRALSRCRERSPPPAAWPVAAQAV